MWFLGAARGRCTGVGRRHALVLRRDTGSEGRPTPQSGARGLSASRSARTPDSTPNSGSSAQCKSLGAMCHLEAGGAGEAARGPAEVPQGQPFREGGQGSAQRTPRCSEERHSGRHDATRLLLTRCSDRKEPKGGPWMKQLSRQKDGFSGEGEAEPPRPWERTPRAPASGRKGPAPSGPYVPAYPPKDVRPSSIAEWSADQRGQEAQLHPQASRLPQHFS